LDLYYSLIPGETCPESKEIGTDAAGQNELRAAQVLCFGCRSLTSHTKKGQNEEARRVLSHTNELFAKAKDYL